MRPHLAWAMKFSLVINLALLTPSLFMLQVYDRVLVSRSIETLVMLGLLAASGLALFGALDFIRSRLLAMLGMSMERRFGPGLLQQQILARARLSQGEPADGLKDLASLRRFLSGPGVVAVFDAPWAVVYVLLIGLFDWRLGLLAMLCAVLLLGLAWVSHKLVQQSLAPVQDAGLAHGRLAARCLQNAEVVTALGMGGALAERWADQLRALQDATLARTQASGRLAALSRTCRQAVQVLMLGAGAWLVVREGATPGVMIAATVVLGRALSPIEQLTAGWQALAEARLAHRRLSALMESTAAGPSRTELPRPVGRLEAEQLVYVVPGSDHALVRQLSLVAQPGEMMAVVGGSGAGKTTLARLLVGVLEPTSGQVRIDGAELRQHDPQRLGAALGYLPQDVELFDGTVAENIARFGPADAGAVISAAQAAGAHELILRLPAGYDTPVGEGGRRLSGGQRQRVALARALFGDPSLIVLDEPDASLDSDGENALVEALQKARSRGAAVVVVTQRRRMLSVADRVLVLRDGAIERTAVRNAQGGATLADPGHEPTATAREVGA